MNLPPLPLIDGHLFVDNSFLDSLNQCPRQCEYNYLHRRRSADAQPALNFGGAIHHALAYRYQNCPDFVHAPQEQKQNRLLEQWFIEKPNPDDDRRNLDLATKLNAGYNRKWLGEEFRVLSIDGKPAVELPFAFPLYTHLPRSQMMGEKGDQKIRVMYCGRIDLMVMDQNDQLFTLDHKTTSIMGEGFFKRHSVNPQMYGYLEGAQQSTQRKFAGFIINGVRVPKPTKAGLVVDDDDFQRLKVYVHDSQVAEWRRNTIQLVEDFLASHANDFMPQRKAWCVHKYGTCEYFDVCSLPPENRELMLNSGQFVDNTWSPLDQFEAIRKESPLPTPTT